MLNYEQHLLYIFNNIYNYLTIILKIYKNFTIYYCVREVKNYICQRAREPVRIKSPWSRIGGEDPGGVIESKIKSSIKLLKT